MKLDFTQWVEKDDGIHAPAADTQALIVVPLCLVCAAVLYLWTGRVPWGLLPILGFFAVDLALKLRRVGVRAPVIACADGKLRIVERLRNWKAVEIDLAGVVRIAVYGERNGRRLGVVHRDGRVESFLLWRHSDRVFTQMLLDYLRRKVGQGIEVLEREPPSWMEQVRGQYEP